ncbi:hypothetical protein VTO73DRAFT_6597 [Trametes versicolor]
MLRYLSRSTSRVAEKPGQPSAAQGTQAAAPLASVETSQETSTTSESSSVPADLPSPDTTAPSQPPVPPSPKAVSGATSTADSPGTPSPQLPASEGSSSPQGPSSRSQKRFSWRSLVQPRGPRDRKSSLPPPREEAAEKATARQEYIERKMVRTRSEQRAHASALVVRELIVGPFATPTAAPPKSEKVSASGQTSLHKMRKVKSQLLEPKTAQKILTQLRALPTSDEPVVVGKTGTGKPVTSLPKGPIHAVCLPCTDAEAHERHFSRLDKLQAAAPAPQATSSNASPKAKERSLDLSAVASAAEEISSVTATSFEKLKEVLADLNLVSLITAPDLGLGHPATGPGLFSGALPSAEAIVNGIEQMTPQLLALGYATGQSILPSHAGIYPPTDRMSVITYWWGLEVVMPEPSMKYLSNVPSIAHTAINFLTALAVANGGVSEILPFVRYISQYLDAEWHMIQQADQGQGVVCAATWIMPAALVPRPWDFPQPPVPSDPPATPADGDEIAVPPVSGATPAATYGSSVPGSSSPTLLTPPLPNPNHVPVFVAPPGDPAVQVQGVRGNPDEGVPGVKVTPPTPPASETLGKAAGEAFKAAPAVAAA